MAKVNLEVARMGYEFQGATAMSVVGTWVDASGTPTPGPMPVTALNVEDMSSVLLIRWDNPNTEPKTFSAPTVAGPAPVQSATMEPFTVPPEGSIITEVTTVFDGTQKRGDVAFIDISGESDA